MVGDPGVVGGSVVLMFGAPRQSGIRLVPSNDNAHQQPVKTVTVRRKLDKSGVAVKVKVPVTEYFGVSISTAITDEGVLSSAIELVHQDAQLNYRVFEEVGNSDVVAEWQNWGQKLRLPLFIRSGDGALLPYSQLVDGVLLGNSSQRKKLANDAKRRPRFLNRRKPG